MHNVPAFKQTPSLSPSPPRPLDAFYSKTFAFEVARELDLARKNSLIQLHPVVRVEWRIPCLPLSMSVSWRPANRQLSAIQPPEKQISKTRGFRSLNLLETRERRIVCNKVGATRLEQ